MNPLIFIHSQDEVDEEDEKLLEAFLSKDSGPQCRLAESIVKRIKEKDAIVTSGTSTSLFRFTDVCSGECKRLS